MHFYSRASCEARQTRASFLRIYTHFYSRASCEARLEVPIAHTYNFLISTHAPLARRDIFVIFTVWRPMDFYSRASCEARPYLMGWDSDNSHFYSRASCEARLSPYTDSFTFALFLLTRLLRGATWIILLVCMMFIISTHAPLARRDVTCGTEYSTSGNHFYSRASCEARRLSKIRMTINGKFLLTRLLRGATKGLEGKSRLLAYFYSRASCEARLNFSWIVFLLKLFLLTRLLRGATGIQLCFLDFETDDFYSRASCEARRRILLSTVLVILISTHAPLARRDFLFCRLSGLLRIFLLTRLLRGATNKSDFKLYKLGISTHAPLARRDD